MPVLEVWQFRVTIARKRGMAAGYAAVENPFFISAEHPHVVGRR